MIEASLDGGIRSVGQPYRVFVLSNRTTTRPSPSVDRSQTRPKRHQAGLAWTMGQRYTRLSSLHSRNLDYDELEKRWLIPIWLTVSSPTPGEHDRIGPFSWRWPEGIEDYEAGGTRSQRSVGETSTSGSALVGDTLSVGLGCAPSRGSKETLPSRVSKPTTSPSPSPYSVSSRSRRSTCDPKTRCLSITSRSRWRSSPTRSSDRTISTASPSNSDWTTWRGGPAMHCFDLRPGAARLSPTETAFTAFAVRSRSATRFDLLRDSRRPADGGSDSPA